MRRRAPRRSSGLNDTPVCLRLPSRVTDEQLALFEHAPCGYALLDGTGLIVAANAEFARILGRTREEVVGRSTLPSLVSAGGRIHFDSHIFPTLAMGRRCMRWPWT